jgi:hypothetical protein
MACIDSATLLDVLMVHGLVVGAVQCGPTVWHDPLGATQLSLTVV